MGVSFLHVPISQSTQAVQPPTIGFTFLLETSPSTISFFSQPFMNTAWKQVTIEKRRLHGPSLLHTKTRAIGGALGDYTFWEILCFLRVLSSIEKHVYCLFFLALRERVSILGLVSGSLPMGFFVLLSLFKP
jgi:hypothetical protein